MNAKRYFYLLTAVFILLLALIVGGAVAGNMVLQKKSAALTDLKTENAVLEMQQTALIQAKKDVERYSDLEKIVKTVVPQDKDQAKTVREIVAIANENSIPIKSVSFPNSTLGEAAAPAPAQASEGGTAPAAPAQQAPMSQVKAVQGIPGVFTLEVQVGSGQSVTYQNFLRFLEDLEKNRRTAHVTGINLEPSDNGNRLNFNLTLNAYLKP